MEIVSESQSVLLIENGQENRLLIYECLFPKDENRETEVSMASVSSFAITRLVLLFGLDNNLVLKNAKFL